MSTNPLERISNILPLLLNFLSFWTIYSFWFFFFFLWFIKISFGSEGFVETLPPFNCEVENLSLDIEIPPSNYEALFNGVLSVCRCKIFSVDECWREKKDHWGKFILLELSHTFLFLKWVKVSPLIFVVLVSYNISSLAIQSL